MPFDRRYIAAGYPKPVVALVVGRVAPVRIPMGHAGAIVASGQGSWQHNVDTFVGWWSLGCGESR